MPEKSSAADAPDSPFPPREPPTILFYLLGQVPFDQYTALQRRLVYELGEETRSRFPVLICEHPPLITVGRRGSRAHIRLSGEQLRWRQLAVRWVSRGGGCILHGPGQLAIYPLVPLGHLGWTVGQYLRRLHQGLQNTLQALTIPSQVGSDDWGIWGRTGQLATLGFSIRNDISQYGAYVNVNPSMSSHHYLETPSPPPNGLAAPGSRPRLGMSSLLAERKRGVRMTEVRAALMEHLCAAWGAQNYHILSGHPFLERSLSATRGTNARAS
jgi:lipoyl(octanoyl) transferase